MLDQVVVVRSNKNKLDDIDEFKSTGSIGKLEMAADLEPNKAGN